MLYEYMQRRSELNNEEFQEIVEQSNSEKMVAEFKTIFQTAKEDGIAIGTRETTRNVIRSLIRTTRLSDAVIALSLSVSIELVKKNREEVKAEKAAAALKKTAKEVTPKKTAKPKSKKT